MQTRPFLLWLAATHAVALTACNTRCDPVKRPYGTFNLTAYDELPQSELPGPGSFEGIQGATEAAGLYMFHDYAWYGYGDLCGLAPVLAAHEIPDPFGDSATSDTASLDTFNPWDTGLGEQNGAMVLLDCDEPDPIQRPAMSIQDWLAPIETAQEAYLLAIAPWYGLPASGGNPVLFTQDAEGFTLAIPNGNHSASLIHVSQTGALSRENDAVCPVVAPWNEPIGGRLCTGVRLAEGHPGHTFAAYAGLEAAAAIAFDRMAEQLDHLGAPEQLIAACRTAADEERVHTALLTDLASAAGLTPVPVEVDPFAPVDLFTFALDNRLEGCIRETFGAMVGRFQADHLPEGPLRDAWQQIATDEEGHAGLSWRIAAWAEAQLGAEQLAVLDARSTELLSGLVAGHDAPAGLPVVPEAALRVYAEALRGRVLGRIAA